MPNDNLQIRVWDPLVRIFHWTLVLAFAIAYLTEDDWLSLHVYAGYLIAGLVVFRLVWGVLGSHHARFGDFIFRPATVISYIKDALAFRAERHLGHNPAGGAMVIALLLSLTATTVSGLAVYGHQEFLGPFAGLVHNLPSSAGEMLEELHEVFANLTVLLVVLHVAGVILASLQHGENLVRSMFTGTKAAKEIH